jgi:hypothetical protein
MRQGQRFRARLNETPSGPLQPTFATRTIGDILQFRATSCQCRAARVYFPELGCASFGEANPKDLSLGLSFRTKNANRKPGQGAAAIAADGFILFCEQDICNVPTLVKPPWRCQRE